MACSSSMFRTGSLIELPPIRTEFASDGFASTKGLGPAMRPGRHIAAVDTGGPIDCGNQCTAGRMRPCISELSRYATARSDCTQTFPLSVVRALPSGVFGWVGLSFRLERWLLLRGGYTFSIDEVISGRRRDDAHLVAFQQRGAWVVDDAVSCGNPSCHFDDVVHEFAHGDGFVSGPGRPHSPRPLACRAPGIPTPWTESEAFLIDRSREVDLGVGAGPEGSVLIVQREDGHGRARADSNPRATVRNLAVK